MAGSCLLHIAVDGDQSSCGRAFSSFLVELALANFPGIYYTEPPGGGSPFGVYWPALVPQSLVEQVVVHADGRREKVPAPDGEADGDRDRDRDRKAVRDEGTVPKSAENVGPGEVGPPGEHDEDATMVEVPLGFLAKRALRGQGGQRERGSLGPDP